MVGPSEKKLGATNAGLERLMLAKVPPLLKPLKKALLAAAAVVCNPGFSARPDSVNALFSGELFIRLSATTAGKKSANMPMPPRRTVLWLDPKGDMAKPKRGS